MNYWIPNNQVLNVDRINVTYLVSYTSNSKQIRLPTYVDNAIKHL